MTSLTRFNASMQAKNLQKTSASNKRVLRVHRSTKRIVVADVFSGESFWGRSSW
jgi:hypothetical protein